MRIKLFSLLFFIIFLTLAGCNTIEDRSSQEQVIEGMKKEVRNKEFIYRLVSEKGEYREGSSPKVYAELEYVGDKEKIQIFHSASPFSFLVTEVTRNFEIEYPLTEEGKTTTLYKGEPFRKEYKGGAGSYSFDDGEEYLQFFEQISKGKFPIGQYQIQGLASFSINSYEGEMYYLTEQIEFDVVTED